jgi:hypothetical protein
MRAALEFDASFIDSTFELILDHTEPAAERWTTGGSTFGRRYVHRDKEEGHDRLCRDYFDDNCTFDASKFRRCFRMQRPLFLHILEQVCTFDL